MSRAPLVIGGLTPFAEMVATYFESCADFEVVAFTAHERYCNLPTLRGRPVVPLEKLAVAFPPKSVRFFAALEYRALNKARAQMAEALGQLGYQPASFVHPASQVAPTARLGTHNLVMEGVVLSHGCTIGDNNILFPQSFLGQQAKLGHHNYLSPGTVLDRFATVADHCFLATGTLVAEGSTVGSWCHTRPRQEITQALATGTTFHPLLRAPGFVVDRRRGDGSRR